MVEVASRIDLNRYDALLSNRAIDLLDRELMRACAVCCTIGLDIIMLTAASIAAAYFRSGTWQTQSGRSFLFIVSLVYVMAGYGFRRGYSYDTLTTTRAAVSGAVLAFSFAAAVAFVVIFGLQAGEHFSRLETAYFLLSAIAFLVVGRAVVVALLRQVRPAIDVSTYVLGDETALASMPRAQGVFNVRSLGWTPSTDDPDFLDMLCRILRPADRILLSFVDRHERSAWASLMRMTGLNTEILEPELADMAPIGVSNWCGSPTLMIARGPMSFAERAGKRIVDLGLVIVLAPVLVPIAAIVAVAIRLDSGGPCLFIQKRVGRNNTLYRCYKFRTMFVQATDPTGRRQASHNDERVTRVGRFLRRTSLDELPQFWNVLIGNMSVVGPRPHPVGLTVEGALFWHAAESYWKRHAVKPGLTGLAQVRGFCGPAMTRGDVQKRVASDLEYMNSWTIWLDIWIVLRTPFILIHRTVY